MNNSNPTLYGDQKKALKFVLAGENLFLTGAAGTGKTHTLASILKLYNGNFSVVAPTGIAAVNATNFLKANSISNCAQTIHKFFGFHQRSRLNNLRASSQNREIIAKLDLLVIDEISMVRADLFDLINQHLRLYGKNKKLPFGGVQLLLVGDLFQLPPVVTPREKKYISNHYASPYFFSSNSSFEINLHSNVVDLQKNYRQNDGSLLNDLNLIRIGELPNDRLKRYESSGGSLSENGLILSTTRKRVNDYNMLFLMALKSQKYTSYAETTGEIDAELDQYEKELHFSVGSRIVMIKNHRDGVYVNGSRGVITKIKASARTGEALKVTVQLDCGASVEIIKDVSERITTYYDSNSNELRHKKLGSLTQFPFCLGWALTIHKSQGLTLAEAWIDLGDTTFAYGQAYVALSRVKSDKNIKISRSLNEKDVKVNTNVRSFVEKYSKQNS